MPGTCINSTGEVLAVYGPKSASTPQDRDNALYRLPAGRRTPPAWDCDGIYVPNDRVAGQLITFEITKTGTKYELPANQGAFTPDEVCCPSNFPTCVCWNIPNLAHDHLDSFPRGPGPFDRLSHGGAPPCALNLARKP